MPIKKSTPLRLLRQSKATDTDIALTIDPGVNNLGIAVWRAVSMYNAWASRSHRNRMLPELLDAFTIDASIANLPWSERVANLVEQLDETLVEREARVVSVSVEFPVLFRGAVGHSAAARGDAFHLAYCCGMLGELGRRLDADVQMYPVNEWIGQLPKLQTHDRVQRLCRAFVPSAERFVRGKGTHHWDAVGLGFFVMGMWP